MTGKEAELQRELHEMVHKTTRQKEEFNKEKNRLTQELKVPMEELKNLKVRVLMADLLCSANLACLLVGCLCKAFCRVSQTLFQVLEPKLSAQICSDIYYLTLS